MAATNTNGRVLSTYEALAVGAFNARPWRDGAEVGTHEVNVAVRVRGTLSIAPDYEQVSVAATDVWRLVEAALTLAPKLSLPQLVQFAFCGDAPEPPSAALAVAGKQLLSQRKQPTSCRGAVRGNLSVTRLAR